MILDLELVTSWVQLAIACVSLVTALAVFDQRRTIRRHLRERRRRRRGDRS